MLRELGVQAHGDGENAFSFGALVGAERARAEDADARVAARWRKVAAPEAPTLAALARAGHSGP